MKRIMACLMLLSMASTAAMAAGSETGIITIRCSTVLSVDVNTDAASAATITNIIDMGDVETGVTCIAQNPFYVWNTSPERRSSIQSYTLQRTGTPAAGAWGFNDGAFAGGVDTMSLACLFQASGTQPLESDYDLTTLDIVDDATPKQWSATNNNYWISGLAKHGNIPGALATPTAIQLWPAIKTPTLVSASGVPQSIEITVTACTPEP